MFFIFFSSSVLRASLEVHIFPTISDNFIHLPKIVNCDIPGFNMYFFTSFQLRELRGVWLVDTVLTT